MEAGDLGSVAEGKRESCGFCRQRGRQLLRCHRSVRRKAVAFAKTWVDVAVSSGRDILGEVDHVTGVVAS